MLKQIPAYAILCVGLFALSACGGGDNSSSGSSSSSSSSSGGTTTYTVGGTITGLKGTGLVLKDTTNNHQVTVAANATTFTISPGIASGTAYAVSVVTQPTGPTQTCMVASGTGTATANVTSVAVTCTTTAFAVGGTITGLTGAGLVIKDTVSNHQVTVSAPNTTFVLPAIASGTAYNVTVLTQPTSPAETCSITSGAAGTVTTAAITNVAITCATTTHTVGGTISGLTGTGLVLKDTSNNHQVTVAANATTFTLTPGVAPGGAYTVTVLTQPSTPAQFCRVTGGTGNVAAANVTSVAVKCTNVGTVVFAANPYDNTTGTTGSLSTFTINPATGALTPTDGNAAAPAIPASMTDQSPMGLAVDPTGNFLYVANQGVACAPTPCTGFVGNDLAVWPINANGTLGTEGIAATISATNQPVGLAVTTSATAGSLLYVGSADTTSTVEAFNPLAGVLGVQLAGSPYASGDVPYRLAVDHTQKFVYAANVDVPAVTGYGIGVTGALTAVLEPATTLTAPYGVAASPIGNFIYVTDLAAVPPALPSVAGTVNLYSYDAGGVLTFVHAYTVGIGPYGIAIDPSGQFLYVSNAVDGTVSGFKIDPTAGTLTTTGAAVLTGASSVTVAAPATALVVDPSSQYLYVANGDGPTTGSSPPAGSTISVMTIDQTTGQPALVGVPVPASNTGGGTNAIAIK